MSVHIVEREEDDHPRATVLKTVHAQVSEDDGHQGRETIATKKEVVKLAE